MQKASDEDIRKRKAQAIENRIVQRQRFQIRSQESWPDFPRHPVRAHTLEVVGGSLVCRSCQKQAHISSGGRSLRDLCKSLCLGNVLKRCATSQAVSSGSGEGGGKRPKGEGSSSEITSNQETVDLHAIIGPGHDMWEIGSLYFCKRCAFHGGVKAKGLLEKCDADPAKLRSKATIAKRLGDGYHPRSKEWLGALVRVQAKNKEP